MKKLICLLLAMVMVLSLVACGSNDTGKTPANDNKEPVASDNNNEQTAEKIVVWTLANDLKQFAEKYKEDTGREVEVVVFDSADYATKIMQTLGAQSKDLDIFVGEPQMLPNFFEAGFAADLSKLESDVAEKLVGYTYQAGQDVDGTLRAVSYQACPGSVIYRRDLAIEVFGTDDPAAIGEKFATFNAIAETAAELDAAGYKIFGDTGALRWFSTNSNPWVNENNEIIVDQDRLDYFDAAVELYQKNYVAHASEWSAPWYSSMAGPLPVLTPDTNVWDLTGDGLAEDIANGAETTQVFSYVMPSWGALIIRDNAADNKGKFGICSGASSFFGGGTFLAVNEFSDKKDAAIDFIEYCTLNNDTAQWWLETSNGDVVSNKEVLAANADYQNESFGNQNTYGFYLEEMENIDYSLITGYDDACKEAFGAAIVSVQKGETTKEEALKEFYTVVTTQFPELVIPADAPIN
ncbi:MAG: extracellular solute-binding protein [Oscillospiraceae bacterium]|nr:extracellular solute-binding protein [Oscillospiraceae bacterium]